MGSAIAVAIVVGVSIAIQVVVIGRVSRGMHPLAVSTALQGSGLLAGLIWVTARQTWSNTVSLVGNWWWLPLGALGWGIVGALGYSSARIGAGTTLAIVVAGQMVTGLILDHLSGETIIGVWQPVGAVLLVVGVTLITHR
jgi:transporter family-2 protein